MAASLKPGGRIAIVLDTGTVSRGSGTSGASRERDIRKAFVEADLIEAVILLPENMFYNTPAAGLVIVLNRRKRHPGEILVINASGLFRKGRPKNEMTAEHIATIHQVYESWQIQERLSAVVTHTGNGERLQRIAEPLCREIRHRRSVATAGCSWTAA